MSNPERLVVVSNRLPVAVVAEGRSLRLKAGAGGLVSAVAPMLRARGGVWLGWAGVDDSRHAEAEKLVAAAGDEIGIDLAPVPITQREVEDYYYGFANEVIWPLFHDMVCYCHFEPRFWDSYRSANARFARAVADVVQPGDLVWIHDYHLMLVARDARDLHLRVPLAFFLHIPFPPLDLFLKLPWRNEILRALTAYDLIGVQTERDRNKLALAIDYLVPEVHLHDVGRFTVGEVAGREIRIGSFPIGIDFGEFAQPTDQLAGSGDSQPEVPARPAEQVLLAVDRLDYSKGIPERLRALAYALERYPKLRGRVSMIQVVVPSRTQLSGYRALKMEIEELVGEINGRFARTDWLPVHYLYRNLPRSELLGYYRQADVAVVTPVKDGMNLVAKEYCAARVDGTGALVLGELAGAACQLRGGALVVNPYDVEGMAEAIWRACNMPEEEGRQRMAAMRRIVHDQDVHGWAEDFLRATSSSEVEKGAPVKRYRAQEATPARSHHKKVVSQTL